MSEINIARVIMNKRREKRLTQDDLANHIGVSKASVSKWETGQSYPDITFLPQLAAYFNMSIDELMGYEPQMTKEDIRKLYNSLSSDFATRPLDEVLDHCRGIAKKYFSCFPLLFQIGALLLNNSAVPGDADKTVSIIKEAKELFVRIKNESDDTELCRQTLNMTAVCSMALGDPYEALELLDGTNEQLSFTETLLASAYQMTGKTLEAKTVLQVGTYKYIVALFTVLTSYLTLCTDDQEKFTEVYRRTQAMAETFDMENLHPSILMNFYVSAAQGFLMHNDRAGALDILEKYTELVTGDIWPLRLKGDSFFDLLDGWFDESALGTAPPRDEKNIRSSMADAIVKNPAFTVLAGEHGFLSIVERLKNNCQEDTSWRS
ncbi:MAG: helix-turn-helix transcriptional regulator [Clostridia bacterium]|jgi:transcriptional regulator with XRE-family HTH domain